MVNVFTMNFKDKVLFYFSDNIYLTDEVVFKFMKEIAHINNVPLSILERAMSDKNTINEFRKRIIKNKYFDTDMCFIEPKKYLIKVR